MYVPHETVVAEDFVLTTIWAGWYNRSLF